MEARKSRNRLKKEYEDLVKQEAEEEKLRKKLKDLEPFEQLFNKTKRELDEARKYLSILQR